MAKKVKTLQQWLTPILRNAARMWPEKNKARDRAKVRVEIGKFKNGNSEFRTMYKCAICAGIFSREETAADHIECVVDPKVGFVDWNTYIDRLFCDTYNFQIICLPCHYVKGLAEGIDRAETRKLKKSK